MLARGAGRDAVRSDDGEAPLSPRAGRYSKQTMPVRAGAPTLPSVDRRYSSVPCGRLHEPDSSNIHGDAHNEVFPHLRSPDHRRIARGRPPGVQGDGRTGAAGRAGRLRHDLVRGAHVADQLCAHERAGNLPCVPGRAHDAHRARSRRRVPAAGDEPSDQGRRARRAARHPVGRPRAFRRRQGWQPAGSRRVRLRPQRAAADDRRVDVPGAEDVRAGRDRARRPIHQDSEASDPPEAVPGSASADVPRVHEHRRAAARRAVRKA